MRSIVLSVALCVGAAYGQSPTPPPKTSVQIVNATSVPAIALQVNGENYYPEFPQGMYTADAPIETLKCQYTATDLKSGAKASSKDLSYDANTNQSLVLLGDFSTDVPPETLRQPGMVYPKPERPFPPNVLFRVVSHTMGSDEQPLRIRVINGMPGKSLTFVVGGVKHTANPGEEVVLHGQKPIADYSAMIDGATIPVIMRQEGLIRNAMIIFYLNGDKPEFMRAFENTASSIRKHLEMQGE